MPKKALASLNVVINAVTAPLFRGLARASKRLMAFGAKMKTIGRSISMSFTLPFAMIGAAGAKLAIDFEQSMTKITTLVGTSAEAVNKLGSEVKAMAVETATPAKDLADALFFIQSAGVFGAKSMETLRVSAKGASMQMGDIKDIASATTSIMTAYGHSSQKSGDLLHETLKQGKFDAAEFMNKIGQVIPTAASFGISFEEMGAAVATMSKISGDAAGSLTAVNQVMLKLMTPGEQQKKILQSINMSYDDLNTMMKDSMLGTLEHLFHKLKGNDEMLAKVFGGARAVKGAFATAGLQAETYAEVLDGMHNSMGNIEKGFQTQSKTVGFKMKQSFEKLKLAGMELGSTLMPVFTAIIEGAVKLGKVFTELDSGTKKLVVGAAALLAFSGPLMAIGGTLLTLFGALLSPIGLTVAAIGALFAVLYNNWGATKTVLVGIANYFITLYNESALFRGMIQSLIFTFKTVLAAGLMFGKTLVDIFVAIKDSALNILGGIGDIILGIFTFDADKVKEGFKKATEGVADTIAQAFEGIAENVAEFGEKTAENFQKGIDATMSRDPIELITEDDIQTGVDNIGTWLTDKLGKVRDKLKGFMGGSSLGVPEGGGEEGGPAAPASKEAIEDMRSEWQKFMDWGEDAFGNWGKKIGEVWKGISNVAGMAINAISNMWAAEHEKSMTILENEEIRRNEALAVEMEREKSGVKNSLMTEEQKKAGLKGIKEKYDKKQAALDKEMEQKKKEIQKKIAKRDKKMRLVSAIMGTAQAIVDALTLPFPLNIIMTGVVAAMGAAQIATIASTPIPLAKGGLAYGPANAIVGDNPGASNDPEVIAPLSKLKQLLHNEMSIELNVGGMVKGNDIYLSNENTTNQRPRYI